MFEKREIFGLECDLCYMKTIALTHRLDPAQKLMSTDGLVLGEWHWLMTFNAAGRLDQSWKVINPDMSGELLHLCPECGDRAEGLARIVLRFNGSNE